MTDSARLFEQTAVHDRDAAAPLRPSEAARIADTLALIPAGITSILDAGCGPGGLLRAINHPQSYGVDLGRVGLRHVDRPAARASVLALPFADDSVDLVISSEVFEHLEPAALAQAAAECYRVARRSVLISVPYREQRLASAHRCPSCGLVFHLHGHRKSFEIEDLTALFPHAAAAEVRLSTWKVRPFNPTLLALRTFGLGLWKHSPHGLCPRCGRRELPNHEQTLAYRLVGAVNQLLNPRRDQPNWLLARFDKP